MLYTLSPLSHYYAEPKPYNLNPFRTLFRISAMRIHVGRAVSDRDQPPSALQHRSQEHLNGYWEFWAFGSLGLTLFGFSGLGCSG